MRAALLVCKAAPSVEVKGASLQVRAGLATGLVVVGDRAEGSKASHEPQVMGETPNRAARLQSLAEPGGVVIDGATRNLLGRMFEMSERSAANLKGFEASVECWDVFGEAAITSRFEALRSDKTPLIGRDEELDLLVKRWEEAKAGKGRVVLISGEPGVGKSRLVWHSKIESARISSTSCGISAPRSMKARRSIPSPTISFALQSSPTATASNRGLKSWRACRQSGIPALHRRFSRLADAAPCGLRGIGAGRAASQSACGACR